MLTAPQPPSRERVPDSFVSTPAAPPTTISHTYPGPISSSTPSSISASPHGSYSNLSSRGYPTSVSMRRQLLRRLWSKENRRLDRTGSLSPPFRRAQRRFMNNEVTEPEVCLECQKLENYSNGCMSVNGAADFMIKRQRFSNNSMNSLDKTSSDGRLQMTQSSKQSKSEKVETSSFLATTTITDSENTNVTSSSDRVPTDNGVSYQSENVSMDLNGNEMVENQRNLEKSEYLIEMEGDQLNVTTTTTTITTTSAAVSEDTNHQIESVTPTPPCAKYEPLQSDSTSSEPNDACNTASDSNINETQLFSDIQNANYPTNENVFASTTTIDKFISQILLDNLNNVVVVEGRRVNNLNNCDNNRNESIIYELKQNESLDNNEGNTPVAIVSYALRPAGVDNTIINQTNDYINANGSNQTLISIPSNIADETLYLPMDEGDEMSDYSAKYSNATDEVELPTNIIISVISGSVYAANDTEKGVPLVVRRLTDLARTESMEAQLSSASLHEDKCENDDSDDDSISLVDSLDEPTTIVVDAVEKSQAFFVPITESPVENHTGLDVAVAASMPEKLRERLQSRQNEINLKRERDLKLKQKELEKMINQNGSDAVSAVQKSEKKSVDKSQPKQTTAASKENKNPVTMKRSQKFLRSEVGLLESYRVDAHGNLQFHEPVKETKRPIQQKKNFGVSAVVSKANVKKPVETKITKKSRETVTTTTKSIAIKRSQTHQQQSSINRVHPTPAEKTKKRKDVQKMTLYHQSNSDIITPDTDCGPRRMYQKTEIQEGEKRIEILEIVECLNSSPDSMPPSSSQTTSSSTTAPKSSNGKTSKIPVPCSKASRDKGSTHNNHSRVLRPRDGNVQNFTPSKNFIRNLQQISNNSRVDQIIADLLIEALNHSADIGIEFVKTPQNVDVTTQPTIRLNGTKRVALATRRTASGSNRRSAHSGKYQQIFDAIPEEKSNLSVDSSTDDVKTSETSNVTSDSLTAVPKVPSTASKQSSSTPTANNMTRGKAAIQSDQDKPEVWFGYFGRSQHESPDETTTLIDEGILKVLHKSGVLV